MKNNLYVVIGKTITRFGVVGKDKFLNKNIIKIETKRLLKEPEKIFETIYKTINFKIQIVYIASVEFKINNLIEIFFKSKGCDVIFLTNENQFSLDLSNLYNPYELGVDLIAQSIYVTHFFDEAIVVSLGTITVIYHIKNNVFSGCMMMPGIQLSLDEFESILNVKMNFISLQSKNFGFNTNEAISIGLLNTIKNIVDNLHVNLKTKCPVIFSGGNYRYFKDTTDWWFIENLDLLGLYLFSKKIKKSKK